MAMDDEMQMLMNERSERIGRLLDRMAQGETTKTDAKEMADLIGYQLADKPRRSIPQTQAVPF